MFLVDSHCHLDFDEFDQDLPQVIKRAEHLGVERFLTICSKEKYLEKTIKIAERFPNVYFAYGLHPLSAGTEQIKTEDIIKIMDHKKMIAIGETGLDYHYSQKTNAEQKKIFREHIELSQNFDLPIIIHSREADEDMGNILELYYSKKPFKGVMHCFSSGKNLAKRALELDLFLSMSGILTFPKSSELRETFSNVPIERILVETDSPYLSPAPFRGKRNEPSFVFYVARLGSKVMGVDEDYFAKTTTTNFKNLFWKVEKK